MNLETKCRNHWKKLGITNLDALKEHIQSLFEKHDTQGAVLEDIYKLVFPEWDLIERIHGYPKVGKDFWAFVCKLFQDFDRRHHPDVMPGGAWLNTGFSGDQDIEPWEISLKTCTVDYIGGQDVEHTESGQTGQNTQTL